MDSNSKVIKNSAPSIIFSILIISVGYAIIRYHLLGSVEWKDFPFFILNKGLAFSAFVLIILNFSLSPLVHLGFNIPESWLNARKALGMTGFLIVSLHTLMSIILFNPTVYSKFFEIDGTLTAFGGLSMLGGVLSFVVLWAYNLSFKTFMKEDKAFMKFITSRKFLLLAMLLGAVHLFFMGFEGWLKPSTWPGNLPPISLVSFAFFCIGYIINVLGRK